MTIIVFVLGHALLALPLNLVQFRLQPADLPQVLLFPALQSLHLRLQLVVLLHQLLRRRPHNFVVQIVCQLLVLPLESACESEDKKFME